MINFCRELLNAGAPGLHFYTLNLERSVRQIISGLESHLQSDNKFSVEGFIVDPGKISRDPSLNNLQDLVTESRSISRGKYFKRRERASRNGSTVVDISIPPPSFKPVSLSLSRSPLF